MRADVFRKLMVWFVIFTFSFVGVAPAISGSRIIPTGQVKVYEGQKLVQVLKQESAFPIGSMLTTEGKCGVRLENLYLVAEDACTFGVAEGMGRKDLRVDKGVVYFALTQDIGKMAFLTPAGVLSVAQLQLNVAANGGILKGYLDVNTSKVQLGVLEGGSMLMSTAEGEKMVRPGKQITLALADPLSDKDKETADTAATTDAADKKDDTALADEEEDDKIPAAYIAGGGALLAAGLLGLANSGGDSSGPGPASPITP